MNDDIGEVEIEDTRPLRAQEVEDRLQRLRAELEVKGRLNAALARAAGTDAPRLPEELLREIEEVAERVRAAEPVSPADLPEALRRELEEINDQSHPPPADRTVLSMLVQRHPISGMPSRDGSGRGELHLPLRHARGILRVHNLSLAEAPEPWLDAVQELTARGHRGDARHHPWPPRRALDRSHPALTATGRANARPQKPPPL